MRCMAHFSLGIFIEFFKMGIDFGFSCGY